MSDLRIALIEKRIDDLEHGINQTASLAKQLARAQDYAHEVRQLLESVIAEGTVIDKSSISASDESVTEKMTRLLIDIEEL